MRGMKIDWKQSAMLAGLITGASLLVNYIFANILSTAVQPLYSTVPAVNPITGTVGEKVLQFLAGYLSFGNLPGMGYLALFISALAVVVLGELAIDNLKLPYIKKFPFFNGSVGRLASVVMYGAIPVYLILVGATLPDMMTVVGVAIYTIAVAVVSVVIEGILKLKI